MPQQSRQKSRWYADGLRFECQPDCGACCTNHGDYAYVYLEDEEIEAIAGLLGVTRARFEQDFTVLDEGYRVLRMDEPDCPFLQDKRCTIYPVRPVQCRTFPFWNENLRNRTSWTKLRSFCPGIDQGERVPLIEIERRRIERGD